MSEKCSAASILFKLNFLAQTDFRHTVSCEAEFIIRQLMRLWRETQMARHAHRLQEDNKTTKTFGDRVQTKGPLWKA